MPPTTKLGAQNPKEITRYLNIFGATTDTDRQARREERLEQYVDVTNSKYFDTALLFPPPRQTETLCFV